MSRPRSEEKAKVEDAHSALTDASFFVLSRSTSSSPLALPTRGKASSTTGSSPRFVQLSLPSSLLASSLTSLSSLSPLRSTIPSPKPSLPLSRSEQALFQPLMTLSIVPRPFSSFPSVFTPFPTSFVGLVRQSRLAAFLRLTPRCLSADSKSENTDDSRSAHCRSCAAG